VDEPPSAASNFIAHEYAIIVPTLVHAASGVVLEPVSVPQTTLVQVSICIVSKVGIRFDGIDMFDR
jgi:hypothetical protein